MNILDWGLKKESYGQFMIFSHGAILALLSFLHLLDILFWSFSGGDYK